MCGPCEAAEDSSVTNNFIDQNRKRFPELAQRCEGSAAILMEYPSTWLVRVSNISSDDWGVRFKITFVPTPGLSPPRNTNRPSEQLSAAWEIFSFAADVWSARYVAWRLHFAPGLVEKVCVVASQMAEEGNQLDYRGIAKCLVEDEAAHPPFS
jgi:hypothetical protein